MQRDGCGTIIILDLWLYNQIHQISTMQSSSEDAQNSSDEEVENEHQFTKIIKTVPDNLLGTQPYHLNACLSGRLPSASPSRPSSRPPSSLSSHSQPSYLVDRGPRPESRPHGTAFLLSPQLLLTVAHNIYNRQKRVELVDLTVSFEAIHSQGRRIRIADYRYPQIFKQFSSSDKRSTQYDYALIKLDQPIHRDKYFNLCINFSNEFEPLSVYGYAELDWKEQQQCLYSTQKGSSWEQDHPESCVYSFSSFKLKHFLATRKGLSGSAIYIKKNNLIIAVALHKGAVKTQESFSSNIGRLFTCEMIENLRQYAREMNCDPSLIQVVNYSQIAEKIFIDKWVLGQNQARINRQNSELTTQRREKFPYSCIGYVEHTIANDKIVCGTGFLIAEDLVLTLLPAMFQRASEYRRFVNGVNISNADIKFYCGTAASKNNMICAKVVKIGSSPTYFESSYLFDKNVHSFCLLKLDRAIKRHKYFNLVVTKYTLEGQLTTAGFRCPYICIQNPFQVITNPLSVKECKILNTERISDVKSLAYTADTEAGMCGSPIWNKQCYVEGLHYGVIRDNPNMMIGRPITIDMAKKLFEWNDKLGGKTFEVHYPDTLERLLSVNSSKNLDKVHYQSSIRNIFQ